LTTESGDYADQDRYGEDQPVSLQDDAGDRRRQAGEEHRGEHHDRERPGDAQQVGVSVTPRIAASTSTTITWESDRMPAANDLPRISAERRQG
jgi:hypothetical protein